MITLTTPCLFRGQRNGKTAVIDEIESARNGDRRFSVARDHSTWTYRFDGSVFMSEIINGEARVLSTDQCEETGLYALPMYDHKFQERVYEADTKAFLDEYRRNKTYSSEELAEAWHELGPTAVNVITGKRLFPGGKSPFTRPVNTARRAARRENAATTLGKIENGATVSFPYNGQTFTATVDKINQTTATVTITKVEGMSNNPRQRPILPGAKGVRVPASILARNL